MTDLQTPHSGYHWDGSSRRFFEGWYYRVTLPAERQTFALPPIGSSIEYIKAKVWRSAGRVTR